VTLTKSAKLKCWPGVEKRGRFRLLDVVVGVERKDEGRLLLAAVVVVFWEGGVEGGSPGVVLLSPLRWEDEEGWLMAGEQEGELAR
jgi:hypothetical protein